MPARLDRPLVTALADAFPHGDGWHTFECRDVIVSNGGYLRAQWGALESLHGQAGVYAIVLPVGWFEPSRVIKLHAPHTHDSPIEFEFNVPPLPDLGVGVVYGGKTTDLKRRIRLHLSRGEEKDGGQVKFGLMNCDLHETQDEALRALREHGQVIYTILDGRDHAANRDVLEITLCAKFAPPFNIKSER